MCHSGGSVGRLPSRQGPGISQVLENGGSSLLPGLKAAAIGTFSREGGEKGLQISIKLRREEVKRSKGEPLEVIESKET